jgi:hypothetical protein
MLSTGLATRGCESGRGEEESYFSFRACDAEVGSLADGSKGVGALRELVREDERGFL